MGSTTSEGNLADFKALHGLSFVIKTYADSDTLQSEYDAGTIQGITTDKSGLNGTRTLLTTPADHEILDWALSKEPLAPVVREGEAGWGDVVRWVVYAMIEAEELGITKANVDTKKADAGASPAIKRLLGVTGNLGTQLGLPVDFAYQVIKLVGNYGEIYDANLSSIPRGQNKLHTAGGLQYSPPLR